METTSLKSEVLDPKTLEFIRSYLVDRNATRAFFKAFGRDTEAGQSRSYAAAAVEASKLLKRPEVRKEIRARDAEQRKRYRVTAEKIIEELAIIAFSDVGDVVDRKSKDPTKPFKEPKKLPPAVRRAIASAKIVTRTHKGETQSHVEFKFHPKQPALDKLYNHLGLSAQDILLQAFLAGIPDEGKFSRDDIRQLIFQALKPKSGSESEMVPDPLLSINCDDDNAATQEVNT
jgi:phage terminase small subunit